MKVSESSNRIYLDNSASTAVDPRVLRVMEPYWRDCMGNAGSLHEEGRCAKRAVEDARATIAHVIHARPESVVFTSGGTESNNMAILGAVRAHKLQGRRLEDMHIITGDAEHNSVYDCCRALEKDGVQVTNLPVDEYGRIDLETLRTAIRENTILISTILVNNEIGTVEDMRGVMRVVKDARTTRGSVYPLVHTDASQAGVWLSVNVQKLGIDFLTLDSQKVYGPKGAGCLFVKEYGTIAPILFGGGQEHGLRPGTPPTPLIVGFAKAMQLLEKERSTYIEKIMGLRDWMFGYVTKKIPNVRINGPLGEGRIAGNLNFSFPHVDGEQLVIELDVHGVAISTRSACLSEEMHESRVIHAIRTCAPMEENAGTIRITMNRDTTKKEVEKATKLLVDTVRWLQSTH